MFDYNKMIERAIKFFPTWSDIRKRYKTSNGGKLLGSITEEVQELEKALEEYKKYYFLDTYKGHENEVVAFSYMAKVGKIKDTLNIKVKYNNEELDLTEDINKFFNDINLSYYEEGKIYIREEKHTNNLITIFINETPKEYELERVHVWNLFDEFACFVGLERHKNENNDELVKRILYSTANKGNATIDGLRNSIISELLIDFPELENEDVAIKEIKIEKVNNDNLREAYSGYNSLLDYLNSINRDVYRWKRWDLDEWQYDFKSINYIPAKWDEVITVWQNGIGHDNDLQVSIAGSVQSTNANITLYKKEKETMNKYLSNKNIEKDVTFQFKRYNDILDSNDINYTIKASPMARLHPNEISLDVYEETSTSEEVSIENIYKFGKDISVVNGSNRINDVYPYRLKFTPKNNNKDIKINKCVLYYINKSTGEVEDSKSLLTEKNGFILNALGVLSSNSIKQSINKVEDFNSNSISGFKNLNNNNGIICTQPYSYGIKNLYNLGGREIEYTMTCEMSAITQSSNIVDINKAYCKWEQNNIIFNPDSPTKKIEVKLTANKFSFDVLTNNQIDVMVRYDKTGPYEIITKANYGTTWSTEETKKPRYMEIVISAGHNTTEYVKVGNFKYSNYEIKFLYNLNNKFIELNNNTLPMNNNIQLKVEINSHSGMYPIINGIYIGNNINNTTYITDSFETKNNCYRDLEIECNCNITLVKRDLYDTQDNSYIENYDPNISYKALSNGAYIRLNLDDYNVIGNIISEVGKIEKIEESGIQYYNLLLEENDIAKKITIEGIKNNATYSVSLLDLVNRELSKKDYQWEIDKFDLTRDRLYCSKLTNGVILLKNNENSRAIYLELNSNLLYGSSAIKYKFNNIPSNIGVKWGVGNGIYSDEITGSFDYISFYPANARIHVANNNYELFANEIKNIPIVENFTEPNYYNPNALNFYTVEPNTKDTDIRFYNYLDEYTPFNELENWSIGIKDLYIKNINDLNNQIVYSINTIDYTNKFLLNEYINLEDSYKISNNNTIYTEQYIIVPPNGMTVKYKQYDGTSATENLIKTEILTIDDKGFKKLNFSNIDKVLYIGTSPYTIDSESNIVNYNLLLDEGIIIWPNDLVAGTNVYIRYTIKKPVALVFDLEMLYKLTGYMVETYKELASYKLVDMKNNETYDLIKFKEYENSDLAYIECSEPSFEGQMIDKRLVKFNKHIEEKSVMVKTGYYYINGKEYYLFNEDDEKILNKSSHLIYDNVDISDDNIFTYKPTNNFVKNSEMLLRGMNDLYSFDCTKTNKSIKFNKYTACESYNGWRTFNTTLELTDEYYKLKIKNNNNEYEGFNNTCIKFISKDSSMINYSFLDISDIVKENNYISIAATKDLKIFIGEEITLDSTGLKRSLHINPIKQLYGNKEKSCIRTDKFLTKNNLKYYLIVQGEGAIDDIIISESLPATVNYHVKNLEKFGLFFNETRVEGSRYRVSIDNNVNCISNGASMCSDKKIKMTSNIDWNITSVKKYETRDDFNSSGCEKDIELIIGDYIKTPKNSTGRFTTDYIEINPKIINRLFFKINDVLLDTMKNIKVSILTCDNTKFADTEVLNINSNYGFVYGKDLLRYVKIKLELPENCIVSNIEILAEYKSDKLNAPIPITPNIGSLISPVFDSQESLNYTVGAININDISNIKDVEVYIRAMTDNNNSGIWSDWELIPLKDVEGKIQQDKNYNYTFENYPVRFFQFKVKLISKTAYIDLDSLELEVKNK